MTTVTIRSYQNTKFSSLERLAKLYKLRGGCWGTVESYKNWTIQCTARGSKEFGGSPWKKPWEFEQCGWEGNEEKKTDFSLWDCPTKLFAT